MIGPEDVRSAARVLDGVAHRTPVVTSRTLGDGVFIKPECLQRVGAFKFRGAYNKISSLPRGTGVLAFSSGNHAQAVALAAQLLGSPATILMPEDAPASKLAATKGYGAEVITYDRYTGNREEIGAELAAERGYELVPPYDDELIMAGQGTAALELLEDVGELDTIVDAARWRRSHRRERGDRAATSACSASSASSRRPATTGRSRSPAARSSRSTCRARSPTGCRRMRRAS